MLLDQRHKYFVSQGAWLTTIGMRFDDDSLFFVTAIYFDRLHAHACAFCIMTKQRTGDTEERIFQIEFFGDATRRRLNILGVVLLHWHACSISLPLSRLTIDCGEPDQFTTCG